MLPPSWVILRPWKWRQHVHLKCQLIFTWLSAIILSRVYGSVTNNNGFWIGWLDLLTPSVTVPLNHNHQLPGHAKSSQSWLIVFWQWIYNSCTVTTAHIKSSFRRLTRLYSVVLLQFSFLFFHNTTSELNCLISTLCGPHGKHGLYC
jgi:hypothetical protein